MADGRGVEEKRTRACAPLEPAFRTARRGAPRDGRSGDERTESPREWREDVRAHGRRASGSAGARGRRRAAPTPPRDISRTIAAFEKEGRGGCRVCRPGFRLVQTERHRKKTTWIEAGRRAFSSIDRSFHATFRERLTTWVKESVIAPECSPPSRRVRSRRVFLAFPPRLVRRTRRGEIFEPGDAGLSRPSPLRPPPSALALARSPSPHRGGRALSRHALLPHPRRSARPSLPPLPAPPSSCPPSTA